MDFSANQARTIFRTSSESPSPSSPRNFSMRAHWLLVKMTCTRRFPFWGGMYSPATHPILVSIMKVYPDTA